MKMLTIIESNLIKSAKILGVTQGQLLRSLQSGLKQGISVRRQRPGIGPVQWDGTGKGADRVLKALPNKVVSTTGGAPGVPAQVFLNSKHGRAIGEAKKGDWIGVDWSGSACIVPAPRS
jgi:hypothetical protein